MPQGRFLLLVLPAAAFANTQPSLQRQAMPHRPPSPTVVVSRVLVARRSSTGCSGQFGPWSIRLSAGLATHFLSEDADAI